MLVLISGTIIGFNEGISQQLNRTSSSSIEFTTQQKREIVLQKSSSLDQEKPPMEEPLSKTSSQEEDGINRISFDSNEEVPITYALEVSRTWGWTEVALRKIYRDTHQEYGLFSWEDPNWLYKHSKPRFKAYVIKETYMICSEAPYFQDPQQQQGEDVCQFLLDMDQKERAILIDENIKSFKEKLLKSFEEEKFWKKSFIEKNKESIFTNAVSVVTGFTAQQLKHKKLAFVCLLPSLYTFGKTVFKIKDKIIENGLFSNDAPVFENRCKRLTQKIIAIDEEIEKLQELCFNLEEMQKVEKFVQQLVQVKNYFLRTCQQIKRDTGHDCETVLIRGLDGLQAEKMVKWDDGFLKMNGYQFSHKVHNPLTDL